MELTKVLFYFSVLVGCSNCIRVCNSFLEYDFWFSQNCNETKRDTQNVSEIMRSWGFKAHDYFLETEDGYIINVVRGYLDTAENKPPVLVAHGLMMNGLNFVLVDELSLGYQLGMAGYDVWIINFRGTVYSLGHIKHPVTSASFWNYSFQEMSEYDIPVTLHHIQNITNQKILYIGYSMGGQVMFMYSSAFPEQAKSYVSAIVTMSPATYLDHMRSPAKLIVPFRNLIGAIIRPVFHGFFFNLEPFMHYLCSYNSIQMYICDSFTGFVQGFDFSQMNPRKYPLYHHYYDAVNLKTIEHFAQIVARKKFAKYDYGKDGNLEMYGTEEPPNYNVSSIIIPVTIFFGPNDLVVTETDTRRFYNELKPEYQKGLHRVEHNGFSHLDVVQAKNASGLLYDRVVKKISEYVMK